MTTIWRYPVGFGRTEHDMPNRAQVLTVQIQHGQPVLWALVEPDDPRERRAFDVYRAGQGMPQEPGRYIGTFQMEGGALVWHVFETELYL